MQGHEDFAHIEEESAGVRGELHARELELQRAYEELGHVRDELRALHSENAVLRVDMRLDTGCDV